MAELRLRVDPSQMVTGAAQAERALEGVADQAERTESATEQMGRGLKDAGSKAQEAGAGVQTLGTRFAAMGPKIQQSAFQIGDFAVQVGAGTSATQAMAQQLPQLLGAFGAMGAVAGAAVAILIPLGSALVGMSGQSKTLEDSLDDLSDALDRSRAAGELARGGMAALIEEFGSASRGVQELARAFEAISLRNLVDESASAVKALTSLYDGSALFNESRREQLGRAFDLGGRAATDLASAVEAVKNAGTLDAQLAAARGLRELFVQMVGPVNEMTSAQLDFYVSIADTQRGLEQVASRVAAANKAVTTEIGKQYNIFRSMMEDERRHKREELLTKQYRLLGEIRTESEAAVASAVDEAAILAQKATLNELNARYGNDSLISIKARVDAEREAYAEGVQARDVSEEIKQELMAAWDAANGVAAASRNMDFNAARDAAAGMASEIERALSALNGMASAGRSALQDERLQAQYSNDPVGLAGARAGAQYDSQSAGINDPILAQAMADQRDGIVAIAQETANLKKIREDAAEAARKAEQDAAAAARQGESAAKAAAREAERNADAQVKALEKQRDAYDGLISRLDPLTGASLRYAEAQGVINDALDQGYITAEQATESNRLASEEMEKTISGLDPVADTWRDVGSAASSAFTGIVTGTKSVGDSIASMLDRIASLLASRAFDTIFGEIMGDPNGGASSGGSGFLSKLIGVGISAAGSLFGGSGFTAGTALPGGGSLIGASSGFGSSGLYANGAAFMGGREIEAFGTGSIVDRPTIFPMAGGRTGMMGEVPGEAEGIFPLKRGSDGRLGIRASGAGGNSAPNINIAYTIDARGNANEAGLQALLAQQRRDLPGIIASQLSTPGTPADRAMKRRGARLPGQ